MFVVVEPYNPDWPLRFHKIKSNLSKLLLGVDVVSIEHVGSTSVPGLSAKPTIDIDIVVKRDKVDSAVSALVRKGQFTYLGERGIVDRHALRDPDQDPPRNVYVCVEGSFQLRNHIGLRSTLRSNSKLRDEYGQVKRQLAAESVDIIEYVTGKTAIIQKILEEGGLLSEKELSEIRAANEKGQKVGKLQTDRLIIREFVMDDVFAFHALESIPEVVRYQDYKPKTLEQAKAEVVKIIQGMNASHRTHFEMAAIHEGHFIGRVGAIIKDKDPKGETLYLPHADLWFSFMPASHGKGFATEAMKAFIPLLPRPVELEIECDPRNTGSWKLAERLGFKRISLTEKVYKSKGEWVDSLVYQRTD